MDRNISHIKITKPMLHAVRELHRKKFRTERGLFLLEGPKLIEEALKSGIVIKEIFALESWFSNYSGNLPNSALKATVNNEELGRMSTLVNPNVVMAVAEIPAETNLGLPEDSEMVLYLDGVGDPGNLGTIIRLADWFGLKGIVLSKGSVDPYNPKVVQASMGSLFRVAIATADESGYLQEAKDAGIRILGADMQGQNVYTSELGTGGIIVLGSESHGMSEQVISLLSDRISIPSFSKDTQVESLNVSMAASIIVSQYRSNSK